MTENQSMTTAEVVAKTLIDEHADFLREAVVIVARELMEAEISTEIGATRGEVSDERKTHRNGYRPRAWETRVGEIELAAARKRDGSSYFPSFLQPRRPCEQAIVTVVMEAYVNELLDPQGRPPGRGAGDQRHRQRPRLAALPRP